MNEGFRTLCDGYVDEWYTMREALRNRRGVTGGAGAADDEVAALLVIALHTFDVASATNNPGVALDEGQTADQTRRAS